MKKWLVAYMCCVALWVACDAALQNWGFFLFENFMRLPLETVLDLAGFRDWWRVIVHFQFWSVGTLILTAYAALGFLPLILVPVLKKRWPLWVTGAFVFAHPGLWLAILFIWLNGAHP